LQKWQVFLRMPFREYAKSSGLRQGVMKKWRRGRRMSGRRRRSGRPPAMPLSWYKIHRKVNVGARSVADLS